MEPTKKDTDDLLKLRKWNTQELAPFSPSYFEGSLSVKELSPKDFDSISSWKLRENKCAIVLFYKPKCPYCKDVKTQWSQLGETAAFFNVYALNADKYKAHVAKIREEMPNLITSYPTIVIYEKGKPIEHYQGPRDWKHLTLACARACEGNFAEYVKDVQLLLLPEEEQLKMFV